MKHTTAPPPACRFYGHNGMFGTLIPQGGNECALITDRYAPCTMEMQGRTPEESSCPLIARPIMARAQQEPTP